MIAKLILIFPSRHMPLSIGELEKSESGKASADFAPNWNFASGSKLHEKSLHP
jgi:hypothetical protein